VLWLVGGLLTGLGVLVWTQRGSESPPKQSESAAVVAPGGLLGAPASVPVSVVPTGGALKDSDSDDGAAEFGEIEEKVARSTVRDIDRLRELEIPPEDSAERRLWHLAHAIPAWHDLQGGLRHIEGDRLQEPVSALLTDLESEAFGRDVQDYRELLARQRQLLGTLDYTYPRHFELDEPMARLTAMLEALEAIESTP
jgi:hypothetical protein